MNSLAVASVAATSKFCTSDDVRCPPPRPVYKDKREEKAGTAAAAAVKITGRLSRTTERNSAQKDV